MSLFVVMGVSGCGKTTIARQLADATNGEFLDADDFHPLENREKMAAGIPLEDSDRWGWLDILNHKLAILSQKPINTFLACSALRKAYRTCLSTGLPDLRFIYLHGSRAVIARRLEQRTAHFMHATLQESQFATLEEPSSDEALFISTELPLDDVLHLILCQIR